jgi:hypothetical protein
MTMSATWAPGARELTPESIGGMVASTSPTTHGSEIRGGHPLQEGEADDARRTSPTGSHRNPDDGHAMRRSRGRFLAAFVLVIASGAAVIAIIPSILGPGAPIPGWIALALGALFAASAVVASRVRPTGGRRLD